ncbi:MAG: hypothetical protein J5I98_12210 [Phaeodactylibacter sp.]|nr:hypothetical protein [Phaeodactylibacter sp.]
MIALVILQIIANNAIYFMVFSSDMQGKDRMGRFGGLDAWEDRINRMGRIGGPGVWGDRIKRMGRFGGLGVGGDWINMF